MSLFSWLFGGPELPPPPPPLFDPWDGPWERESLKCPACGSWGYTFVLSGKPMMECPAHALSECRVATFTPRRPPEPAEGVAPKEQGAEG